MTTTDTETKFSLAKFIKERYDESEIRDVRYLLDNGLIEEIPTEHIKEALTQALYAHYPTWNAIWRGQAVSHYESHEPDLSNPTVVEADFTVTPSKRALPKFEAKDGTKFHTQDATNRYNAKLAVFNSVLSVGGQSKAVGDMTAQDCYTYAAEQEERAEAIKTVASTYRKTGKFLEKNNVARIRDLTEEQWLKAH